VLVEIPRSFVIVPFEFHAFTLRIVPPSKPRLYYA
jgi:hypothetical protein